MRLGLCALSAVLLSGCSWLGTGGHSSHYAYETSAGANCGVAAYGQNAYGHGFQQSAAAQGFGYGSGACGAGGGYNVGQGAYGYGPGGLGQGAYGQGSYAPPSMGQGSLAQGTYGQSAYGYGQGGLTQGGFAQGGFAQGMGGQGGYAQMGVGPAGYGQSGYGAGAFNGVTTLGASASYGSALGGAYGQNVVGTQLSNGQYVNGAYVQNVQGSPLYVPQPYPAYYGVPQFRGAYGGGFGSVGGVALPFGVELGGGTNFDIGGDIFTEKAAGPASGNPAINTGGTSGISYADAFSKGTSLGGALTYDVSQNTTLLGVVDYTSADGDTVNAYQTVDARGAFESIDAEFSDLDLWTIEGGVRQYIGQNPGLRPYVGATAGFTHNNDVTLNRTYSSDGAAFDATPLEYVDSGWNPTASAVIGAEMAVGSRAAIGVESGLRWRDNMDTLFESEDRWSVPVKLRGRVSF